MKIDKNKHIILYTKNAIIECLKSKMKVHMIITLKKIEDEKIKNIIEIAENHNITIKYLDSINELNKINDGQRHQNIIACLAKEIKTYTIEEIINTKKNKIPLIIICNGITDTSNFGNIIRSSEAFGINGIIISKNNSCSLLNDNVFRTSCGAIFNIKICVVSNINFAIDKLKQNNIWVIGSVISNNKELYCNNIDLKIPLAMVLGSEENGINTLTRKKCDYLVTIPMIGNVGSINVNNASAILLYEILRQRHFLN